jgi:hypothetical protein
MISEGVVDKDLWIALKVLNSENALLKPVSYHSNIVAEAMAIVPHRASFPVSFSRPFSNRC